MSVDSEFLLEALLCHNYLPLQKKSKEELPPIFSTEGFTPHIATELAKLEYRKGAFSGYDQVEYKLTRFNSVGRLMSIPHPLPHAKLCLVLHKNWGKLGYILANQNSRIKPQRYADGRVMIMNGYGDSVENANRQLNDSFGKRYRVNADIAGCFSSIYSHAVPWALVSQKTAKAQRPPKHANEWFNLIDKHLRACRRDETQGIAIGPGSSSIVAEIILARVDAELSAEFKFTRHIDDYTCYCESEEIAEKFIRRLEQECAQFKLQLNIKKTKIERLPLPVTDDWVVELGRHMPESKEISSFEAFRYLDFAVQLSKSHPEGSVLKYAAGIIAQHKCKQGHDATVLNYLLNLAFHNPVLLPVLSKLIDSSCLMVFGQRLDFNGSTVKLEEIVRENARLTRSDGMCWGLYYLGHVKAAISEDTAQVVIGTGDALAMLTLYWASETHREAVALFFNELDKSDLYQLDRYWILLYQLFLDGRIDAPYSDDVFTKLRDFGVNFLLPLDALTEEDDADAPVSE